MAVDNGQGKGKFVTSNSYVKIKGKKVKQWITVNGKHIPIFEGESKSDAIVRAMDKDMERNPEMKKANDAVVEHSNKVAEKERNKREYELKKKDKEITDRAAREKLRNQISKDFDEKERQIRQNEKESERLRDSASFWTRSADAALEAAKKHTKDKNLKMFKNDDGSYAIVSKQGSLAGTVKKDDKGRFSLNIKNPGFKVKPGGAGASVLSLARKIVNEDIGAQEQAKLMNEMYEKTDKSIKKKDYIARVMSEVRRLSSK